MDNRCCTNKYNIALEIYAQPLIYRKKLHKKGIYKFFNKAPKEDEWTNLKHFDGLPHPY